MLYYQLPWFQAGKLAAVDINDCIDENEALDSGSEYQPETDDSGNVLPLKKWLKIRYLSVVITLHIPENM